MGAAQSCAVVALPVCSVYLLYVYIYCSHKLLKTNVLHYDRLPSFAYLYIRYLSKAVTRTRARLCAGAPRSSEVVYTALSCRLESPLLRRFCSAAGYGWDYPDTDYRDVPLCFPEFLCRRLLLMALTDDGFRLSPAGLVRVRQTLKTVEPVDELKKGPFTLQVRVLEQRQVEAGVEVNISLSATSRTGRLVWASVLTLLSTYRLQKARTALPTKDNENEPVLENVKQVELRVPRTTGLQCVWSFSASQLLALPARLFGYRSTTSSSLWMLSVCLAEIEKHKGVGVITAPINVTVQFKEPLLMPGRVSLKFWETTKDGGPSSVQGLSFHMQQHESNISHMVGFISRS